MGERGPSQTPTRVLELRGTFRRDRHGDPAAEPQFELVAQLPKPPGFLDRVGKMEWNRVGPELVAKQLLTVVDMAAFTSYCIAVSRLVACEKIIRKHGMTLETPQGFEQARPEVAIAKHCTADIVRLSREFGLTPSARTRVRVPDAPAKPAQKTGWSAIAGGSK